MNFILNVLLGIFLFSCDGNVKKQAHDVQEETSVATIAIEETPSAKTDSLVKPPVKLESAQQKVQTKPEVQKPTSQPKIASPNQTIWASLLEKYVDVMGNINYSGIKDDIAKLDAYLAKMAQNSPANNWTKNEKLAYYINLYNAATVKLIVDHYPVKSIKDIPNRWKKKWIKVGSETTSLNDIEHEVLRKMNEPRIHFAINCASYSCPKLLNVPFTPQSMERLLTKTAVDFVNDKTRNRFGDGFAQLSRIFKWYKGDFTENGKLLDYINQYLDNPIGKNSKIEYLDYDWSLNEAK